MNRKVTVVALLALVYFLLAAPAFAQCGPGGCAVETVAAGCPCDCPDCTCGEATPVAAYYGYRGEHSVLAFHGGQPVRNVARFAVRAPARVVAGTARWFADHRPVRRVARGVLRVAAAPVRFVARGPIRHAVFHGGRRGCR